TSSRAAGRRIQSPWRKEARESKRSCDCGNEQEIERGRVEGRIPQRSLFQTQRHQARSAAITRSSRGHSTALQLFPRKISRAVPKPRSTVPQRLNGNTYPVRLARQRAAT